MWRTLKNYLKLQKFLEFCRNFIKKIARVARAERSLVDGTLLRLSIILEQRINCNYSCPKDTAGKELIRRIFEIARQLQGEISVVFLPNYDLDLARTIVSGVDLWLNTPQRPLEASGTSGMKAAHNGVPSFSVLDGWWVEGCIDGVTGWSIGSREPETSNSEFLNREDGEDLYQKLQNLIVPMFDRNRERWIELMRQSIALNASFFNTHRMVQQYVTNAYLSRS